MGGTIRSWAFLRVARGMKKKLISRGASSLDRRMLIYFVILVPKGPRKIPEGFDDP